MKPIIKMSSEDLASSEKIDEHIQLIEIISSPDRLTIDFHGID